MTTKKTDRSFLAKWGPVVARGGYTQIPNLLVQHMDELGVRPSEFKIISGILVHKRSKDRPFPSIKTLSRYSGLTEKSVSRLVGSLRKKGLISTGKPNGKVNRYDFTPLIRLLETYAQPPQKQPSPPTEMRVVPPTNSGDEEEAIKKKRERRYRGSGKLEHVSGLMPNMHRGP